MHVRSWSVRFAFLCLVIAVAGCDGAEDVVILGTVTPPASPTGTALQATATAAPPTASATHPPASPTATRPLPTATTTASPAPSATSSARPNASASPSASPTTAATATSTITATASASPTLQPTTTPTSAPVQFRAPELVDPPGPRSDGSGVLPSGRIVRPAGRQALVDTLPLSLKVAPNGRVLVTNDGHGNDDFARYLHVIDPETMAVTRAPSTHFFGLTIRPDGARVYVTNSPNDSVDVFAFDGVTLTPLPDESFSFPSHTFPNGLEISADGQVLYVTGLQSNSFWRIDLASRVVREASGKIGNWPYNVLLSRDGQRAFVTSWGINNNNPGSIVPVPLPPTDPNAVSRSSVAVIDITGATPEFLRYIPVARSRRLDNHNVFGGSHPSAMALSPDGKLLYVTASNLDLLSVIDTETNQTVTDVDLNVFQDGLQGMYPDAIAVSADGGRLYIADAGINAVQVIDVDQSARTFTPRGFIPTGWYPSALALSGDGQTLFVASAKGLAVGSNGGELVDINLQNLSSTPYYIGRIIKGMVSAIPLADVDLQQGTAAVRTYNGFDALPAEAIDDSVVPRDFGSATRGPIKHVVYILKENRTYDQILGDLEGANGEPRLTLFGEDVTPNHHALARQFAIGDNFFHDAEVSYPGHEWVTQGNNNDWVEKIWPLDYNNTLNTPFNIQSGQEGFCEKGYIFEQFLRQGITLRSYGEPLAFNARFAAGPTGGGTSETLRLLLQAFGSIDVLAASVGDLLAGRIEKLRSQGVDIDILEHDVWPHVKLDYPSNILADRTDVERAELFKAELAQFEASGELPRFLFIWIPNDHTFGAAPRMPNPRSALADNDRGLGLIVEALSKSRFWSDMAIFVTEDDAQDGQDHVAAHRTLSYVVSPYAKRHYVSHVHHSTMSMLKTMELLLGAQPMSQYDRYATDMRDYFSVTPDLTPYSAVAMRVHRELNPEPEDQPNFMLREAGEVSEKLDLDGYDEAGPELSRVLWLAYAGDQLEHQKRLAVLAAVMLPLLLIAAAVGMQRFKPV